MKLNSRIWKSKEFVQMKIKYESNTIILTSFDYPGLASS